MLHFHHSRVLISKRDIKGRWINPSAWNRCVLTSAEYPSTEEAKDANDTSSRLGGQNLTSFRTRFLYQFLTDFDIYLQRAFRIWFWKIELWKCSKILVKNYNLLLFLHLNAGFVHLSQSSIFSIISAWKLNFKQLLTSLWKGLW